MSAADYRPREVAKYPRVALQTWHGLPFSAFAKLLIRNRCSFSWQRSHRVASVLAASLLNSVMNRVDAAVFSRRVEAVEIGEAPLFILGHWRTGTTLLQELLACDDGLAFASTYQCIVPKHFLLTQRFLPPLVGFLIAKHRPMDGMPLGWRRPIEDEFALSNQGVPSPYWCWLYPDRPCPYDRYLDLEGLSEGERDAWKAALLLFVKRVSLRNPKRLVLKSPTHTARVATLLEVFPKAKFVHLVRDPQAVIPSTLWTWQRMGETTGLHLGLREDLADYVFDNFRRLDRAFEAQRGLIPDAQFLEMRYETLVDDMKGGLRRLYDHLALPNFETAWPKLAAYLEGTAGYRRNAFDPGPDLRARISEECADYAIRYGYASAAR